MFPCFHTSTHILLFVLSQTPHFAACQVVSHAQSLIRHTASAALDGFTICFSASRGAVSSTWTFRWSPFQEARFRLRRYHKKEEKSKKEEKKNGCFGTANLYTDSSIFQQVRRGRRVRAPSIWLDFRARRLLALLSTPRTTRTLEIGDFLEIKYMFFLSHPYIPNPANFFLIWKFCTGLSTSTEILLLSPERYLTKAISREALRPLSSTTEDKHVSRSLIRASSIPS